MDQHMEKRQYPRVKSDLSLKIGVEGAKAITKAENISLSGVYCKVDSPIPLMSRIQIILLLPKSEKKSQKIETTGVVVREHPVIISGKIIHYDVAIFFDSLSPRDRDLIAEHVKRKLQ